MSEKDGIERYRHKARGTEYDLIGTAELQDATGAGVEEGALLAIYRGDDGKLWARRHREFGDGRFERIALAPTEAEEPTAEMVEAVARALIEKQIRSYRQWDTAQDVLEKILPAAVARSWPEREDDARIAIAAMRAACPAGGREGGA